MKRLINPSSLYDGSPMGLSHGTITHGGPLLFVSGQVAWDLAHTLVDDTVAGQFAAALENLRTVLDEAGCTPDDLLQMRIYIRGELEDHMAAVGPILTRFLGASRTAITGVGVASLASKRTLVEVEAVARIPQA